MKHYESGFLALTLTGILMMVIGLALMVSTVRAPDGTAGFAAQGARAPSSVLAMRVPAVGSLAPATR